ncbi:MAG: ABC transporter permease [Pseudodesulfovibrio sp.]
MAEYLRRYGRAMTAYIFLSTGLWLLGMVLLPQLMMVDYSFWSRDEAAQARAMEQADILEDRLDRIDAAVAEAKKRLAAAPEGERPVLRAEIDTLEGEADAIEPQFAPLDEVLRHPPTRYGFKNYAYLLGNTLHRSVFFKTMVISLLVTFLALALCYPVAYYLSHAANARRAGVIVMGLMIPYWVNEILRTFAWLMILSKNGLANATLQFLGLADQPLDFLNTDSGIVIGMIYCYVLFMVFPIYNTLETLDHNQIEAARDLGASWPRIHWDIAIPHAKPGIAVGCIMTFMVAVGTYAVPSILGGTSTLWFTQIIYSWFFDGGNWNQGAAYAFALLVLCVAFVMLMLRVFKVGLEDIAR